MSGPLSHVRVLDLSRIMAGPWSSQNLADLGADVTKVERPGAGDDTRAWGPPFLKDSLGQPTTKAGYYLCVNCGKRSINVDISTAEGQNFLRKLALRSDIVLHNYKVGTLKKYGADAADDPAPRCGPGSADCRADEFPERSPRVRPPSPASWAAYG